MNSLTPFTSGGDGQDSTAPAGRTTSPGSRKAAKTQKQDDSPGSGTLHDLPFGKYDKDQPTGHGISGKKVTLKKGYKGIPAAATIQTSQNREAQVPSGSVVISTSTKGKSEQAMHARFMSAIDGAIDELDPLNEDHALELEGIQNAIVIIARPQSSTKQIADALINLASSRDTLSGDSKYDRLDAALLDYLEIRGLKADFQKLSKFPPEPLQTSFPSASDTRSQESPASSLASQPSPSPLEPAAESEPDSLSAVREPPPSHVAEQSPGEREWGPEAAAELFKSLIRSPLRASARLQRELDLLGSAKERTDQAAAAAALQRIVFVYNYIKMQIETGRYEDWGLEGYEEVLKVAEDRLTELKCFEQFKDMGGGS